MKRNKILILLLAILLLAGMSFSVYQFFYLRKAHSSFENYYKFRGCVQLIQKTDIYGTCKIYSGKIIRIVEINNKWYLDGDGPGVW